MYQKSSNNIGQRSGEEDSKYAGLTPDHPGLANIGVGTDKNNNAAKLQQEGCRDYHGTIEVWGYIFRDI